MAISIEQYITKGKNKVEEQIKKHMNDHIPKKLYDSMHYSLFAGGKRIRPVLLFASLEAFNGDIEKGYRTAAALEMIHTYSLIHDDLPAMDDDDYRRSMLTNHKKFDEATAILAGDALLTYSFELISADPLLEDQEKIHLITKLAQASGPLGMVGGQILDLAAETKSLTLEELEKVHQLKTGQLISFAIYAGAFLGGASQADLNHLESFSHYLGLIFQVQDDILDVIGDAEKLGKPVGSDSDNEKSTYPKLLGIEGAKTQMLTYKKQALTSLNKVEMETDILRDFVSYIQNRDH